MNLDTTLRSTTLALALCASLYASPATAAVTGDGVRVVNSFEDATLTGGLQGYFGQASATVGGGVELPGFIGFYDIDVSDSGLVMTLINNSGATDLVLPAGRFDRYYVAFDMHRISSATLSGSAALNAFATVELVAPGNLPLAFEFFNTGALPINFANGGLLVTFGPGTDLRNLGVHAQLSFVAAPVPEPATWALLLAGLATAGAAAGRRALPRR